MAEVADVLEKLADLDAFLEGLSVGDRANFAALLSLHKPELVIAMCPNAEWKKHWVTALAVQWAQDRLAANSSQEE